MNSCAFSLPSFASDSPGEAVRRTESGARAVTQYMDKDYGKRSGRHCMAVYRRAVSRGRIQTVSPRSGIWRASAHKPTSAHVSQTLRWVAAAYKQCRPVRVYKGPPRTGPQAHMSRIPCVGSRLHTNSVAQFGYMEGLCATNLRRLCTSVSGARSSSRPSRGDGGWRRQPFFCLPRMMSCAKPAGLASIRSAVGRKDCDERAGDAAG